MKKRILLIFSLCLLVWSCDNCRNRGYDRVCILYSAGNNSLNWDLRSDIIDLCDVEAGSYVPYSDSHQALVVIGHLRSPDAPFILNIYRDRSGKVLRDTTFYEDSKAVLTDPAVMRDLLLKVKEKFPSEHYGMILSSHGTGWIPAGKFNTHTAWLKSFGADERESGEKTEMDITDLPHGIPFHLDYMLFDACLMGNIESVYELKDVSDYVGASATEVLTDGFDYIKIANRLLAPQTPSPSEVCKDYIAHYKEKRGDDCSACICLVKTSELGELAMLCRKLFTQYRSNLQEVDSKTIQRFFRPDNESDHNWYFDMEDIARQAGFDSSDFDELSKAIGRCVIFKDHTDSFLIYSGGFEFERFCGLGMYLQNCGLKEFDDFYRDLKWNKDTDYVK